MLEEAIIVVDDGSSAPVDEAAIRQRHGDTVRVLRNATNRGLAYCRNLGVEACSSEFVIHLDDDDLLASDAIEVCLQAWEQIPGVELVMFSVEGFGACCGHFNTVQPLGVEKVVPCGTRNGPSTRRLCARRPAWSANPFTWRAAMVRGVVLSRRCGRRTTRS